MRKKFYAIAGLLTFTPWSAPSFLGISFHLLRDHKHLTQLDNDVSRVECSLIAPASPVGRWGEWKEDGFRQGVGHNPITGAASISTTSPPMYRFELLLDSLQMKVREQQMLKQETSNLGLRKRGNSYTGKLWQKTSRMMFTSLLDAGVAVLHSSGLSSGWSQTEFKKKRKSNGSPILHSRRLQLSSSTQKGLGKSYLRAVVFA